MQSITVIADDTRMFRVRLSHVRAEKLRVEFDPTRIFFEFDFDQFRTYTSKYQTNDNSQYPIWDEEELLFTYETEYHNLLAAKLCRIRLYCIDPENKQPPSFVGEGNCDLQTIACGPPSVTLDLENGNTVAGIVKMNLEVEEVAETICELDFFSVRFFPGAVQTKEEDLRLRIITKSQVQHVIETEQPYNHAGVPSWNTCGRHYFGTTVMTFMQEAGLRFEVLEKGTLSNEIIARGMVLFSSHLQTSEQRGGTHIDRGTVEFRDLALFNDEGAEAEIGKISGRVTVLNMPRYAQMYAGENINGVVHRGKNIVEGEGRPMPLRVASMEK